MMRWWGFGVILVSKGMQLKGLGAAYKDRREYLQRTRDDDGGFAGGEEVLSLRSVALVTNVVGLMREREGLMKPVKLAVMKSIREECLGFPC